MGIGLSVNGLSVDEVCSTGGLMEGREELKLSTRRNSGSNPSEPFISLCKLSNVESKRKG